MKLGLGLGLQKTGKKEYYLEFDGTNWVDLLFDLILPFNSGVSLSIWYKLGYIPDSSSPNRQLLGNSGADTKQYIRYDNNRLYAETDLDGEYGIREYSPPLNMNWHHLVYTIANGTTKWYIDRVEKGSKTITTDTTLNRIGKGSAYGFFGGLTKIAKWNRVLSPTEITQLYAGGNPKNSKAELISGITNYWNFHEGKGLIVADIIGGNNGTRMGGATLPQWRKL